MASPKSSTSDISDLSKMSGKNIQDMGIDLFADSYESGERNVDPANVEYNSLFPQSRWSEDPRNLYGYEWHIRGLKSRD